MSPNVMGVTSASFRNTPSTLSPSLGFNGGGPTLLFLRIAKIYKLSADDVYGLNGG